MQDQMSSAEYRALKARAARSRILKMARVRRLAAAAGIDPGMPFMHASNALCGLEYGRPWPNVDYSKVRLIRRLEDEIFAADHIVDRLAQRRCIAPRPCGCPDDCGCRRPWRVNYCGCKAHA